MYHNFYFNMLFNKILLL